MVPPANQPEVKMLLNHLTLLLLFMVIFDVKVKVVVKMR
jgi:hypothetical protein